MNDSSIIDKELEVNGQIKGSLALRIFLISLILLILPLTIHSLFLYRQEYRERKRDLLQSLEILGESRALLFNQTLHFQQDGLSLLQQNGPSPSTPEQFQTIANQYGIFLVLYLKQEGGRLVCKAASDTAYVGQDFSSFTQYLSSTPAFFLNQAKELVVSLPDRKEDTDSRGFYLAINSAEDMIHNLSLRSPYLVNLFLVDERNQISVSSDPSITLPSSHAIWQEEMGAMDSFAVKIDLKGSDLSLILSVPKKSISDLQFQKYIHRILSLFFLIFILGGAGTFLLVRRISKPLKNLIRAMEKVYHKDRSARYHKDPMGFEINLLGEHFNRMIDSLIAQQKEVEKERVKKELLEKQFSIGREIQMSLFPSHVPDISGLDISAHYQPAQEVGGDFYDLFVIEPTKKLGIVIADTSGKGISACLYSLGIRSILRSLLTRSGSLSEAVLEANRLFCLDTGDTGFFVTAWIGIYDPTTHILEYTSCGHYPGVIRREGELLPLQTEGIALGVTSLDFVKTEGIKLQEEDLVFLYTDGVIDTWNLKKELFGGERLEAYLKRVKQGHSSFISKELISLLEEFAQGAIQYDDLTFLVFKMK